MNRLKELRKRNGMSQTELAAKIGISQGSLSGWETGRYQIDNASLQKLSTMFGVSIDYLLNLSNNELPANISSSKKGVKIPVLGRVQAGVPVEAIQEILDYEEITEEQAATGDFFGLRVRGHSMEPVLLDEDVVIVRQQPTAENGDTVVALVNGDDATVKRFKHTPNGIALIPANPMFDTLYYSYQQIEELPVRIIGKVVELRRKF